MRINAKIVTSVAGASIVLTLLGVLSKGIGFIREIIYANKFGLSSEFDLFLSSIALPNMINTAVIYLSQHYFIPHYNKIKEESELESTNFFNYTFWWFVIGGMLLSFFLYLTAGIILRSYLSSISTEMQQIGINIFNIFLITIPLNAGMSIIMAYQQANFKFIYPAFSLTILNVVVIIIILLFSELLKIYILPFSFLAAYTFAFVFLIFLTKKDIKFIPKNTFKIKYKLSELNILLSLAFIEGLSLSYVLIDRYFIGEISEGGIAALNYAFVIYSLPISLFSIPLITTMFSKFSSSPDTLQNDFKNSISINYFIMIPFTFILFGWGDLFLRFFYERGKFTSSDTLRTFEALKYYSISLIFLSTYFLIVKILYSRKRYTFILIISIIAFFLKILFNVIFLKYLEQNGLALSTSIIYIFLCVSSTIYLIKEVGFLKTRFLYINLIFLSLNGFLVYVISHFFLAPFFNDLFGSLILNFVLFVMIYLLNLFILKDNELRIVKDTLVNILKR